MPGSAAAALNKITPDNNQSTIKKCSQCDLLVTSGNMEDHLKSHSITHVDAIEEVTLEEDISESSVNQFTEVEQASIERDENESAINNTEGLNKVVLVKLRTKYWPAEVISSSQNDVNVKLCKRGEILTISKEHVMNFVPDSTLLRGQSRIWKDCYRAAMDIIDSES